MMFLINSHSLVSGFVKSPHTFGYHGINLRETHTKIFLVQKDPNEMRVAEIKEELNTYSVSYSDCFDKESLVQRLISTREENPTTTTVEKFVDEDDDKKESEDKERVEESVPDKTEVDKPTSDGFDRESTLQELRSLRVAELRTRLSSLEIRWGNMIEKEELVLALANAMEESSKFSGSGVLSPGKVGDLNSKEFNMEVSNGGKTKTPMLLDVYATWVSNIRNFHFVFLKICFFMLFLFSYNLFIFNLLGNSVDHVK